MQENPLNGVSEMRMSLLYSHSLLLTSFFVHCSRLFVLIVREFEPEGSQPYRTIQLHG